MATPIRAAVRELDANVPLFDVRTMDEVRSASVSERRFIVVLASAFGLISVMLAIVGVYGVTALAGCIAGFVAFVMLSPVLDHYIYGVARLDPIATGAVPTLLLGVAILACLVPAMRVLQIEPAAAIRAS